jgi:hypothetical protein
MRNRVIFCALTLIAAIVLWCLYRAKEDVKPSSIVASSKATPVIPTNSASRNSNAIFVAVNTEKSGMEIEERAIDAKYRQGLINKEQLMQSLALLENEKSQDLYGEIVDQSGNPVADAAVAGELTLNDGTYGGIQVKKYSTVADGNGLFAFTGIHGAGFSVRVNKEGYKIGERGEGYKGPLGGNASPSNRAIFTMWKLHGAEPLVSSGIDAKIPHDGNSTTFDIATGKESADGDLRVTLIRSPLGVRRGKDIFDWALKIEMLNGGLIDEKDAYDYWAPETGYQPSYEFNVSSNNVPWHSSLDEKFYIKTSQGKYGRMQFGISSALTPARIEVSFTINPSGSQNLEPPVNNR